MALFDEISKKITNAGQNVVKGTKDFAEVTRLNSLISDEQKQASALLAGLGERFYNRYRDNLDELGEEGAQYSEVCAQITAVRARIAQYQEEVQQIKGIKACAKCGGDVPVNAAFCSSCGAVVEKTAPDSSSGKRFCAGCGATLDAGAVFCTSCGQKTEQE